MKLNILLSSVLGGKPILGEDASSIIRQEMLADKPSMIARFGSVEIKGVLYPSLPFFLRRTLKRSVLDPLENNAGFFPASEGSVGLFSDLMYQDMRFLDILGSWRIEERLLRHHFPDASLVELRGLEPYFSRNPWSEVLEDKKVVVVHPFNLTIEKQYFERRERLFADKRVLPRFKSLNTIKAVQTIAGNRGEYPNWFAALDVMKRKLDALDYDVAILGCGAYGFPLAAHVKRKGKKAVHLGGATQVLFGIRGRRWDNHPVISGFYNEHWVRPSPEDVPQGASKVENGCYW